MRATPIYVFAIVFNLGLYAVGRHPISLLIALVAFAALIVTLMARRARSRLRRGRERQAS